MGQTTGIPQSTSRPLPFADAAAKVLDTNVAPLHYRDITQKALAQTLIQTNGKTPEASLNAKKLIDLLIEYGIGVRIRPVKVLELDADAFAQVAESEEESAS